MKRHITPALLNSLKFSGLTKVIEITDTIVPGFVARVRPSGRVTFVLVYRFGGRGGVRRTYPIGHQDTMTIAAARDDARRLRGMIRQGIDPFVERQREIGNRRQAYLETGRANTRSLSGRRAAGRRRTGAPGPAPAELRGSESVGRDALRAAITEAVQLGFNVADSRQQVALYRLAHAALDTGLTELFRKAPIAGGEQSRDAGHETSSRAVHNHQLDED